MHQKTGHLEQEKLEIWVVDNNSDDGSRDQIAQTFPHINLVLNDEDPGFSGGTNCGVEAAMKALEAPILFINNDGFISEDDAIQLLLTIRERKNIGLVAPLLFNEGEYGELISVGGKGPVKHHQTCIKHISLGDPVKIVEKVPWAVAIIRGESTMPTDVQDKYFYWRLVSSY